MKTISRILNSFMKRGSSPINEQEAATVALGVFNRIAGVLLEDDLNTIERLDKEDKTGQAVNYFILSRVPFFDKIVEEEITKILRAKEEQSSS